MTTSGSIDWTQTRNQIIKSAFRKLGAISQGETPSADATSEASDALNAMIHHFETSGIHLFTETEGTLWLTAGQPQYGLGGGSTDHATLSANYKMTTLSAASPAADTTIVVTSTTGFAASYYVGVVLDDGSMSWSTEVGAPAGSTITLATGLTSSAAAGNLVFVYQTQIERPLRIVGARKVQWNSAPAQQIETPMNPMLARLDYRSLPNKFATGVPTQAFYDPQLVTGQFYIWPSPQNSVYGVNFTFYRTIQDFDAAANTPDLPQEWIRTLVWNLAVEMAPEYDVKPDRFNMLKKIAAESLEEVHGWDREPESYLFGVSFDQTSGN